MKKAIFTVIAIIGIIGIVLCGTSFLKVLDARSALQTEIIRTCQTVAMTGSKEAFKLAKPYLDPEDRGRIEQRLETLEREPFTLFLLDSHKQIIWDLAGYIKSRVLLDMYKADISETREEIQKWLKKTPYEDILELHQAVQAMESDEYDLTDSKDRPWTLEGIRELRSEYLEHKKYAISSALEQLQATEAKEPPKMVAAG